MPLFIDPDMVLGYFSIFKPWNGFMLLFSLFLTRLTTEHLDAKGAAASSIKIKKQKKEFQMTNILLLKMIFLFINPLILY